ncbi:HU family DNA-binding protein, partial [Acidithiobacillus thiooxidans]|uniref:HU family DNA-binding protein n=1 Tax=Acidithiobacillus thiooxidans TaxID=930 RepID=UPI001C0650AC
ANSYSGHDRSTAFYPLPTQSDEEPFRQTLETELLVAGKITFPGFCSVEIVDKPARKARNPATGQEIEVPAKKSIKFKAGKEFVDKVNH